MILGISGKMGVGKTTIAEAIVKQTNQKYVIYNFADLLKHEVSVVFNIDIIDCYTEEGKNSKYNNSQATIRDILQWYGSDIVRKQHPMHWVNAMRKVITESGNKNVIIPDVRFPNEDEFCDHTIRINPYKGWDKYSDHISETALDALLFSYTFTPDYGRCNECATAIIKKLNL